MHGHEDLVTTVFDLIHVVVELYLTAVIRPFMALHEVIYSGALIKTLQQLLHDHKSRIPAWLTANSVAYSRVAAVLPVLVFLSWGHALLPVSLTVLFHMGGFLHGAVASFWEDVKKESEAAANEKKDDDSSRPTSPIPTDNDSFGMYLLVLDH